MADKNEEEGDLPRDSEGNSSQTKLPRPVSGKSGGSTGSKKSMTSAVGQLTAKALREFRLDDEGTNASESGAGGTETVNTNLAGASGDANEGPEGETLLEDDAEYELQDENELEDEMNDVEFDENINVINDDDLSGADDSDGDNDLVVLDPDHVSSVVIFFRSDVECYRQIICGICIQPFNINCNVLFSFSL
jgi:hypothetical protein